MACKSFADWPPFEKLQKELTVDSVEGAWQELKGHAISLFAPALGQ